MKNLLLAGLCIATFIASGCSTLTRSDSGRLQGTWKGQEVGRETQGICTLIISGSNLEFRGADAREWYKGEFTLKENTKPAQLIGIIRECPNPRYTGKAVNAIYKIEDGTLTLTGCEPGSPEFPTDFASPNTRTFLLKKDPSNR